MNIEVYGDDFSTCNVLKRKVQQAVAELGLEVEIRLVMDPAHLSELHALSLPPLVANGQHHDTRTTMSVEEIKEYLQPFD